MQLLALIAILAASLWTHPVEAQGHVAESAASRIDPAFAAMLLVSAESLPNASADWATALEPSRITKEERLQVRRGRWLLGTGIGIAGGAALAGAALGAPSYCHAHENYVDKTAPRVTSAVLGSLGLVIASTGAFRLWSVAGEKRRRAPAGAGQTGGIAAVSVGVSLATMVLVGFSALPGAISCGTT